MSQGRSRVSVAARALGAGLWAVAGAPWLVVGVAAVTLLTALPFALVVGSRVQASLAAQPQLQASSDEIDPEWWMEFRAQARGLEATFTPTILGFAAPLDNISAVLDGTRRPLALLGPVILAMVAWAFLWGGLLHRFAIGQALTFRGFIAACGRYVWRMLAIAAVAAVVNLLLYLSVHRVLFGPVFDTLVSLVSSERDAFFVRVALYAVFGALLIGVSLVADYARVAVAMRDVSTTAAAFAAGTRFLRGHFVEAALLYLMTGALFVIATAAYGSLEIYGGSRVGGWRAVAIGQAFILTRLVIRLTFGASEVRLFQALSSSRPVVSPRVSASSPP